MNLLNPRSFTFPNSPQNLETFELSARAWRKRNLFMCGPLWSFEIGKSTQEIHTDILKNAYTDLEIQDALIDWHKAYRARVPDSDFDSTTFQRIKAIEVQSFLNTGLGPEKFGNWIAAVNLLADYRADQSEAEQKACVLIGEKVPDEEADVAAMLPDHYSPANRYPGAYPAYLQAIGYGPIMRSLKIAQRTGVFGGFPFLVGQPSTDPNDTSPDFFRVNKAKLLSIVRPCTLMMNDKSISLETIQASECGVDPAPSL